MSESQQIQYLIYTEEQMTGFIEDGIMHKTIREIIYGRNVSALCDLIMYTDTYDPDILVDALNCLSTGDLFWFITNREVIKTMFPATYTNILSNTFVTCSQNQESDDTPDPQQIITALLGLFDTTADDYSAVMTELLTYENMVELFDYLSELDPKLVIQLGADKDLFHLLEQILLTNIKLTDGNMSKIPCLYTTEVQTYLDMLGNYIMPQLGNCEPMIIKAYDAMRQYLVAIGSIYEPGIHVRIYIQFANKFHSKDREIFCQICQVICQFPKFVRFTTDYGGMGIFLECCRFDMPEELIQLLDKYDICPATLSDDLTNYKIIAKIFYAATQPEPRPQIHESLWQQGYFSAYIEWFNRANLKDLQLIDTCAWPLTAILDDNLTTYPDQDLINLKAYDSPTLLLQFLTLNDLTNTGEIQAEQTVKIAKILKDTNLTTRLYDTTDSQMVSEIIKHLRTNNGIFNPILVRNKLGKLKALETNEFISQLVYKYLEQEVFVTYIHQLVSENFDTAQLGQLLGEYRPDYSIAYWEALLKSGLKAKSPEFSTTIGLLKDAYFQKQCEDQKSSSPIAPPTHNELIRPLYEDINNYQLELKCDPETLVGKFAIILKEFHKSETIDHCAILTELIILLLPRLKYTNQKKIYSYIQLILVYSTTTDFEFQLSDELIVKIRAELDTLAETQLDTNTFSNILIYLSIVLIKHTKPYIGIPLILNFLSCIFITNESLLLADTMELRLENKHITPELCYFMRDTLIDSEFCVEINMATTPEMILIKPVGKEYQKIQNSRWRNWCASRQISYDTMNLALLTEHDTVEFICPITFEPQKIGDRIITLTGCGHKFSAHGIIEWCRDKKTCPMCRANLADGKLSGANCEMFELVSSTSLLRL